MRSYAGGDRAVGAHPLRGALHEDEDCAEMGFSVGVAVPGGGGVFRVQRAMTGISCLW